MNSACSEILTGILLTCWFRAGVKLQPVMGALCDASESFTNPLDNFTCHVIDRISDATKPSVVLRWDWAIPMDEEHFLNETSFYSLVIFEAGDINNNITYSIGKVTNKTIDLEEEDEYTFIVYFDCENSPVSVASCMVNTLQQRTPRLPERFPVSCLNTNIDNIVADENAAFHTICLHGNITYQSQSLPKDRAPGTVCLIGAVYIQAFPTKRITVTPESCGFPALPSAGRAQLRLSCSDSMAAVEVVTPEEDVEVNSTELKGKCIVNQTDHNIPFDIEESPLQRSRMLKPGRNSISNLPGGTICTFYGNYNLQTSQAGDFEPVQCIVSQPTLGPPTIPPKSANPTPSTPLTTSNPTTYLTLPTPLITSTHSIPSIFSTSLTASAMPTPLTPPTSSSPLTSSTPPTLLTPATFPSSTAQTTNTVTVSNFQDLITYFGVVVAIVIVIVTITAALFVWISCTWRMRKEQKKQLHIWDDFMSRQEGAENLDQDPCVLPQFPYCPSHSLDTHSVTTEVDYLYKQEKCFLRYDSPSSFTNAKEVTHSPQLIIDLNGSHQRVWKGSHESLYNALLPQLQNNDKLGEWCQETKLHLDCTSCKSNDPIHDTQLNPDSIAQYCTNTTDSLENANVTVTCADHNTVCGNPAEDYAPPSLPPEHCFTDDEGYLHFKDKNTV